MQNAAVLISSPIGVLAVLCAVAAFFFLLAQLTEAKLFQYIPRAAGYTLLHDGHVRVDIFYGGAKPKTKALINFVGVLIFLWPVCVLMIWMSWIFVGASVRVWEGSPEGTFMPFWLLKALLLSFPVLLSLQGFSMAVNSVFVMTGVKPVGNLGHDGEEIGA